MQSFCKNILFLFLAATVVLLVSCKKQGNGTLEVNNISYTSCLNHTDKLAKQSKSYDHPDSISVRYENGTAYITHYNLALNCAFEVTGVLVDASVDGSTITIDEYIDSNGPIADCICETNNSFQIDNISPGTYTLIFNSCYPEPYSVSCTFE